MNLRTKSNVLVLICIFLLTPISLFAQQYQIRNITYEITGKTREYALSQAVDIDTKTVFKDENAFNTYLSDLRVRLQNERVFESTSVEATYGAQNEQAIIPVDLTIYTTDSISFLGYPNPNFDTNEGLTLKLDSKNTNFLGTMRELNTELFYEWDFADVDDPTDIDSHSFGLYTAFLYPFSIEPLDFIWSNSLALSYTTAGIYEGLGVDFSTGLNTTYKLNDIVSFTLSLSQGIDNDVAYERFGDALFFTENVSFSMPITLVKTDLNRNLTWTPNVSTTFYWDKDGINTLNEDLYDTSLNFGHSFSWGRTDWIGNFKNGFSVSFQQTLGLDLNDRDIFITNSATGTFFKAFTHVGIRNRVHLVNTINDDTEIGGYVRGVANASTDTNSALAYNFALPIKVWQTNWVGYGLWNWTEYLDFELQLSPFFDFAIGQNPYTNTQFNPKDGYYGAGLEAIVFPTKFRSFQARVSVGVDLVKTAEKVGYRIDFVESLVDNMFTTSWRRDSWYELSIGFGLFY